MATMVFVFYPEMGHLNPTLKFARILQARGHAVHYFGLCDFEERVRSQGMSFIPMFESLCPKGFVRQAAESRVEIYEAVLLLARKSGVPLNPAREFAGVVGKTRPDLFVIDLLLPELAALVSGQRLPTVLLNTQLYNPWKDEKARREESERFDPVVSLPELILCPERFDFPHAGRKENSHYIEASIDLERKDTPFPWHRIDDERPLLYCSFGSQSHLIGGTEKFFRLLIEAVGLRPDWQAAVAIGSGLRVEDFGPTPPNVVLVNTAPQLELLERASVVISHGGFNSVKECIFYGVPMLLFPVIRDHPAIAARVVYHGLGLSANIHTGSVEQLNSLIDRVSRSPSFKTNVVEMSREFRRMEDSARGAQIIEALLRERRKI
jgi:UDP:flavonoid glycosyltransferase YjiC (YdhE family)